MVFHVSVQFEFYCVKKFVSTVNRLNFEGKKQEEDELCRDVGTTCLLMGDARVRDQCLSRAEITLDSFRGEWRRPCDCEDVSSPGVLHTTQPTCIQKVCQHVWRELVLTPILQVFSLTCIPQAATDTSGKDAKIKKNPSACCHAPILSMMIYEMGGCTWLMRVCAQGQMRLLYDLLCVDYTCLHPGYASCLFWIVWPAQCTAVSKK